MAWKYVISEVKEYPDPDTPSGVVFRPVVSEYANNWSATDGRLDERLPDGHMLVHADIIDEAGAKADSRLFDIQTATTSKMRNVLIAMKEPTAGIAAAISTQLLVKRLKVRFGAACGRNRKQAQQGG